MDRDEYDGPPAWWTARQEAMLARRPLCDEYGTPMDEDDSDGDESADDDGTPEGDGGEE